MESDFKDIENTTLWEVYQQVWDNVWGRINDQVELRISEEVWEQVLEYAWTLQGDVMIEDLQEAFDGK